MMATMVVRVIILSCIGETGELSGRDTGTVREVVLILARKEGYILPVFCHLI